MRVDGLEDEFLLGWWQGLDLLDPALELGARFGFPVCGLCQAEQLIGRHLQGQRKPGDHLVVRPQLVALVFGDQALGKARLLGQFDLGQALVLPGAGQALAKALLPQAQRRHLAFGSASHNGWHYTRPF